MYPSAFFPLDNGDLSTVVEDFHRRHEERYGFSNRNAEVELVNLRLRAVGRAEKTRAPGSLLLGNSGGCRVGKALGVFR